MSDMSDVISSASQLADYLENGDREDWAKTIRRMVERCEGNPKELVGKLRKLFQGHENLNDIVLQHAGIGEHYLSWNKELDELRSNLARQITEIEL